MTDVERSRRVPIDEAEFEVWLAETLNLPTEVPRPVLDPRTEPMRLLMQHMRETLVPVEPSPNFVRDLGQSLMLMASRRQVTFRQRYGRAVLFGLAAAGSVASVVSMGVYWYYRREQRQSRGLHL